MTVEQLTPNSCSISLIEPVRADERGDEHLILGRELREARQRERPFDRSAIRKPDTFHDTPRAVLWPGTPINQRLHGRARAYADGWGCGFAGHMA